ncbi:hypothetical protein [Akkermansia sp.]|uniref:hypothetical protein n=1 Tax=Akkermansia sp. TaxID=1872421 RepID=UPI003AB6EBF1
MTDRDTRNNILTETGKNRLPGMAAENFSSLLPLLPVQLFDKHMPASSIHLAQRQNR